MPSRHRILIVEDEPAIARGLRDVLRNEGFAVTHTPDGETALSVLSAGPPDLLLLDVNLPGMTGLEVARRVRADGYAGPILMLSALADPLHRVMGLEAGADDYVGKPFHRTELLARVRAHLRARPAGRTAASGRRARRLLRAVLFSDMRGFSARMNTDERRAMQLLRRYGRVVEQAIRRCGGTVVEVIGDGFLATFESALKAAECAVAIRRKLGEQNAGRPADERIRVRVGIHLGDVVEEDGRIRGNAVNVAARLQSLAKTDEIVVSKAVFDAVEGRLAVRMTCQGSRKLKNIRAPVTVYRIRSA